jgi:transposase-like protein
MEIPNNESNARMMRGMNILQGNCISRLEDGSFVVPSLTRKDTIYEVRLLGERYVCTCPDYETRSYVECCKHIYAVKFYIATNRYLKPSPKSNSISNNIIKCEHCNSLRIVRYGHYNSKQIFKCKDCLHKFREQTLLKRVKFSPELITLSLDLYFSGLSLRKIARNVNDHFNIEVNFSTIYTWIERYIPIISSYVNSLKPQLSETWQADELFVKMKNGESTRKHAHIAYLWNIMDRKSRFLIASKLSEHRDIAGAKQAFNEAIHNSGNAQPHEILTDSWRAYREGISASFNSTVDHIAKCGINKPHANNNRAERLNGTLRERTKVQRGWKSMKTPIAEGQRIHYNFVKPHIALNGETPASRVGIGIQSSNKWKNLANS